MTDENRMEWIKFIVIFGLPMTLAFVIALASERAENKRRGWGR